MRQLVFVMFAIPAFVFGQDTNFFYEKDVFWIGRTGTYYHKSDSSKVTGLIKRFRKNGLVEKEIYVVDGLLNGEGRYWCDNGQLKESGSIYNNKDSKGYVEVTGWHCNGQLAARGSVHNKQRTGTYLKWFRNGHLEEEKNYVNGKEEGSQRVYHENGHLKSETTYVNGKLEGLQREYYMNGKLGYEINYVDGEKERETTYYKRDGDHDLWTKAHVEGNLDGLHKEYYYNGQLKSEGNYVQGELVKGIEYFLDGKIKNEVNFELGEIREWYNAHSGQPHELMLEAKLEGDIWVNKVWYRDGTLKEVFYTNKNGERVGVYQGWYANGALKYEINYDDNGKFISSKEWDINGQPMD